MKNKMMMIFSLLTFSFLLIACGSSSYNENTTGFEFTGFEFQGFEIEFGSDISWTTLSFPGHDLHRSAIFSIPVTVTRLDQDADQSGFLQAQFGPNGIELEPVGWLKDDDINLWSLSNNEESFRTNLSRLSVDEHITGNLYFLFIGDGLYAVELNDWRMNDSESFIFTFAVEAPEGIEGTTVITPHEANLNVLAQLNSDDFEITFLDDISFQVVNNFYSELNGHTIFTVPAIVENVGTGMARSVHPSVFNPNGVETTLNSVFYGNSLARPILLQPGATWHTYIEILFDGEGRYEIEFFDFSSGDQQIAALDIQLNGFEVPEVFSQHSVLNLGETFMVREFEVTFLDELSWSETEASFSIPVRITNHSDFSGRLQAEDFMILSPAGNDLNHFQRYSGASDGGFMPTIRPGVTFEMDLQIDFAGNGEYQIIFPMWFDWMDDITVSFQVQR